MGLSCRQRGYSSNVGFCRGFDQGGGKGQVLHLLIACPLRRRLKRRDRRRRRAAVVSGAAQWFILDRYPEHATPASK